MAKIGFVKRSKWNWFCRRPKPEKSALEKVSFFRNGSLFTCFTATVTVNGLENEMSSELLFSRLKMGGSKAGYTLETPKGSRGVTPA